MQISVIIPVYNAAEFVTQAVESALAQPETGQVLLIEDGSSDASLAVCGILADADGRVELLQHESGRNRGVALSRNLGMAAARCPCVAFLDADDYYLPGRFAAAVALLDAQSDLDGVYDAVGTLYDDVQVGQWYREQGWPDLMSLSAPVSPATLFEALVAGDGGYFHGDGLVVRTQLLQRVGGFDPSLRMGEDTAMWIKLAALGRLAPGMLREPVAMRRIHGHNTIFHGRQEAGRYAVQMAESLVAWGRGQHLPRRRRVLLLDWLLNFQMEDVPGEGSYALHKLREIGFLAAFALDHPLILQSRHFWSLLAATVGCNRLRGLLHTHESMDARRASSEVA